MRSIVGPLPVPVPAHEPHVLFCEESGCLAAMTVAPQPLPPLPLRIPMSELGIEQQSDEKIKWLRLDQGRVVHGERRRPTGDVSEVIHRHDRPAVHGERLQTGRPGPVDQGHGREVHRPDDPSPRGFRPVAFHPPERLPRRSDPDATGPGRRVRHGRTRRRSSAANGASIIQAPASGGSDQDWQRVGDGPSPATGATRPRDGAMTFAGAAPGTVGA